MHPDFSQLTKRYYTISEVADMFGVSKSLIRYWESEFEFLKPHKNSKGDRRFTIQNIEQFDQIYTLVKEQGFTLEGARKALKTPPVKSPADKSQSIIKNLTAVRNGLQGILDKL